MTDSEQIQILKAENEQLKGEILYLTQDRKLGWQIINDMADSMVRLGIQDWAPIVTDARTYARRQQEGK